MTHDQGPVPPALAAGMPRGVRGLRACRRLSSSYAESGPVMRRVAEGR